MWEKTQKERLGVAFELKSLLFQIDIEQSKDNQDAETDKQNQNSEVQGRRLSRRYTFGSHQQIDGFKAKRPYENT